MSKTRVVNIITDLNIGGAGKVLQNFYSNCSHEDFEHWVIVPKGSLLIEILRDKGIRVVAFEHLEAKSFSLKSIGPLTRLLKKIKPDIVHTHACLSGRIAASLCRNVVVMYTRHCVYEPHPIAKSFIGRALGWVVFSLFSDRAIAITPASMKNLTSTGIPGNKVDVLMNGTEPLRRMTEKSLLETRNNYGIAEDEFVFTMLGRLEEIKGHRYFIKAAKIVSEKEPRARFLIAGEGNTVNELKKMAMDMGDRIIFAGFIKDVYKIVNITDVLVNASYGTEASSLAIIEAMSLGKPMIASDYGENPYQVEDNVTGLIIPQKDETALADAMLKLMKDKNIYEQMSIKSVEVFRERFTAAIMAANIEDIYRKSVKKDVPKIS